MPKQTTWIILAIIVLALSVGGYLYFSQQEPSNTNVTDLIDNIDENSNAAVAASANNNTELNTADWLKYENSEFAFRLRFPEDWKGFTVETYRSKSAISNEPLDYSFVSFVHPSHTSEEGLPGKVSFTLYYFDKAEDQIPIGIKTLEEKGNTKYGWSRGTGAAPGNLHDLAQEIDSIIATFETF